MAKDIMTYKGFYGTIHYSDEDKCLYGHIVGISDTVSYEGTTIDEITADFRLAVDHYIEVCEEMGKTPLKSAKGSFNVRIGRETHLKALIKADAENKTLNQVVREAVEKEVEDMTLVE